VLDSTLPSQSELRNQAKVRETFNLQTNQLADQNFLITGSTSLTLARDTRDNSLNTTRGSLLSATGTLIYIGNDLTKWSLQYAKYINPIWKFVFAYQFDLQTIGNTFLAKSNNFTSDSLYYFNREELRGWEYNDIIARRVDLSQRISYKGTSFTRNENASYYLGQAKVRHSLELRFPIFEQALWGLGFIDAGNISVNPLGTDNIGFLIPTDRRQGSFGKNLGNFFGEYLFDMGLGLRLQIPAFPIRLYVSWKFIYNSDTGYFEWRQPVGKYLLKDESLKSLAAAYRAIGNEAKAVEKENAYSAQGNVTGIPEPTIVFNVFGYF
jgi:outer membrane protein assembly factor BamA